MIDVQFGPLGGVLLYVLLALLLVSFLVAPTLGGFALFALAAAVVFLFLFFGARRIWLRAAGRRGGRS